MLISNCNLGLKCHIGQHSPRGETMKDVITSRRLDNHPNLDIFVEAKIQLEQMEAMKKRIEHLMELNLEELTVAY